MACACKFNRQADEPGIISYGISFLSVAAVFMLVLWVPSFANAPALLLLCTILLSALKGGYGPGLLAIAMSILGFEYYVIAPVESLAANATQIPRLVIFAMTAVFIGGLGAVQKATVRSGRRMHEELTATMQELIRAKQALERENAERIRVHEQLARSEAFLTEGQRISHTGSWRWEIATGLRTWSDEHYRIFGYDPRQPIPSAGAMAETIHPEDLAEFQRAVNTAIEEERGFECEFRIRLPDGVTKFVHGTGYPLPAKSGRVEEYMGTTVDVTARRQAEDLLRKREHEYRTLAENLPDGVIRYDLDCRRIYVNPAYERLSTVPAELALTNPRNAYWRSSVSVDSYIATVEEVMQTGTPNQVLGTWETPDGRVVYYATRIVAERNLYGEIIGSLAITRDISQLKETEQSLEESQRVIRELANENEAIREEERKHLARELHDDLAQHLFALRLKISLVELEYGGNAAGLKEKAQDMICLVDSTVKVVRNVMTTLRPMALDMGISAALEWLVDDFAAQNGIPCTLHFDADDVDLPERSALPIFRIAQEALRNIAKHAHATKAEITFRQNESGYLLEAHDNGRGFNPTEKKAKSFGLIGIRERVLLLNGDVDIVTAPQRGTSVRVTLPFSAL
jgi:PAS domain S-box-containing protein